MGCYTVKARGLILIFGELPKSILFSQSKNKYRTVLS
jgi:hypothetical protein